MFRVELLAPTVTAVELVLEDLPGMLCGLVRGVWVVEVGLVPTGDLRFTRHAADLGSCYKTVADDYCCTGSQLDTGFRSEDVADERPYLLVTPVLTIGFANSPSHSIILIYDMINHNGCGPCGSL